MNSSREDSNDSDKGSAKDSSSGASSPDVDCSPTSRTSRASKGPAHAEDATDDVISVHEAPRKPFCALCARCCRCNNRSVVATYKELEEVQLAMKHLTLSKDVVIGGELIHKQSHLLKVGRRWHRQGYWVQDEETETACNEVLNDIIDEEDSTSLTFSCPSVRFPWCMILKLPCCTFCTCILAIVAICVAGIRGNITIETSMDSFLDSDSQSSLYYNAFLDALAAQTQAARRLHSCETFAQPRFWPSWSHYRQKLRKEARLPILDREGKMHPVRYLARKLSFDGDFDYGDDAEEDDADTINSGGRRLSGLYKLYKLTLIYATKDDSSILSSGHVSTMNGIEQKLKAMPEYNSMCKDADAPQKYLCQLGVSFANIVFAHASTGSSGATTLYFNGSGQDPLPMEQAVGYAQRQSLRAMLFPQAQSTAQDYDVSKMPCGDSASDCADYQLEGNCKPFAQYEMYMRDFCAKTCNLCGPNQEYGNASATSITGVKVSSLRSSFHFKAFCCATAAGQPAGKARLKKTWDEFVPEIVKLLSDKQDGSMRIFYSGDDIESYEAMQAVQNDLLWAVGSYFFVMFYATLHTRSIILAVIGLFLVMLSIPSALSIFSIASGSETVSLMMCLSIFIVIGIGSDMLFVYTDFWKQSLQHSRDPVKRLKFTYAQAATSTAATTFTTAMSFLANMASVLRPLREFGFFMGACVVMAWLIMFFAYPPILVVGERCHRRIRRGLAGGSAPEEEPAGHEASMGRRSVAAIKSRGTVAMATFLDPEKKGLGEMHQNILGARFAVFLGDWKCSLCLSFLGLTIMSAIMAVSNLKDAAGAPQIFPDDHNQVLGKTYDAKFQTFDEALARGATGSGTECSDLFRTCIQFRCLTKGRPMGSAFDCQCLRHDSSTGSCTNPAQTQVSLRVIARQGLPIQAVQQANVTDLTRHLLARFPAATITPQLSSFQTSDILVDNWESGVKMLATLVDVGFITAASASGTGTCIEKQVCYCAMERCSGSDPSLTGGTLHLFNTTRRLHAPKHSLADPLLGRKLQSSSSSPTVSVRVEDQVDVNVVIGMEVTATQPRLGVSTATPFKFVSGFELKAPQVQRDLVSLCEKMDRTTVSCPDCVKNADAMKIWKTRCWVTVFRDHWIASQRDWPVRPEMFDINQEVYNWADTTRTDGLQNTIFFWFDSKKIVKATRLTYILSISKNVPATEALEVKAEWDTFIDSAGGSLPAVWHASNLWMRAEAEKVILDSTMVTLAISLGCVFLGIFLFTFSLHLAFLVMIVVFAIIICLLFFMTTMMEWEIGAIEVLCLIVFVGFAVDYCLHVAHKYHTCHIHQVEELPPEEAAPSQSSFSKGASSSRLARKTKPRQSIAVHLSDKRASNENAKALKKHASLLVQNRQAERFERTKYALERMGGAVVGSACTTMGCAAFLLPCQLQIFTKIGYVVMAVTAYAILYTVLPLPSLLMLCGPCGHDLQALKGCVVRGCARILARCAKKKPKKVDTYDGPRRYVLHMPPRSMGVRYRDTDRPKIKAFRTRVTASG